MIEPKTGRFPSQRITLSYAEWGDPEAPPLFLVHGGRDQKRSWDWVASELAKDWRVIAHDLRGHGQSDHVADGSYTIWDHVYDVVSLVNHFAGPDAPVTLLGHSLGGNLVVRYAGIYPQRVKKLIAIEGLGPSPRMIAERAETPVEDRLIEWIEQRQKQSERAPRILADLDEAKSRMANAHPHLSEEQVHHLSLHGIKTLDDGAVTWAYDAAILGRSASDITQEEIEHLWRRIECPTLLVYGGKSWASNPTRDGRIEHFRDANVIEYETAGHWLHHDELERFVGDVKAFLG